MPTGKPKVPAGKKRVVIELNEADYEALAELGKEQYRTPSLQAGYLIMRVLADAGRSPSIEGRKEKLIGRVAEIRAGNGAQE